MEYTHQLLDDDFRRVSRGHVKIGGAFIVGLFGGLAVMSLCLSTPASVIDASNLIALPRAPLTTQSRATPQSVMAALEAYGMPPSPFEKLAITAAIATRDVSMKAQVQEEMNNLDADSKAELKQIDNKVVVRTMALEKEKMAGATAPLGFWDPAGISTKVDAGMLYFLREAELKHGRFAMMASLGILVGEKFHPFFGEATFTNAIQVHIDPVLVEKFWPIAVTLIGIHELFLLPQKPDKLPGDLGWDPLGMKPKSEAEFVELQNKELNNGRLAMFAAMGMIAEELIYGKISV